MFHLFHQCFDNVRNCLCLFVINDLDGSFSTLSSVSFRSGNKSSFFLVIKCDSVNAFSKSSECKGAVVVYHTLNFCERCVQFRLRVLQSLL